MRTRVLVVGQVPPPHHGQAAMVETLLRGRYTDVELVHLDASYSDEIGQIGRVSARKVGRMLAVVAKAVWARAARGTTVLYYHPAGSNRSAIARDAVVLALLRPLFRTTVFHHHAMGLVPALDALPRPAGALARRALRRPDVSIAPSAALLEEVRALEPGRAVLVPNGTAGGAVAAGSGTDSVARVLFLNLICEAKGAFWLLDALAELARRGTPVRATFAGAFPDDEVRARFLQQVRQLGLDDDVELPGVVTGADKWATLGAADVFCVPTRYPQESFGLAAVEAASCGLAVVATDVPGVREVFRHGEDALLADPHAPDSLVELLQEVCTDASRRGELGRAARALYERRYTEARYWRALDEVFSDIAS